MQNRCVALLNQEGRYTHRENDPFPTNLLDFLWPLHLRSYIVFQPHGTGFRWSASSFTCSWVSFPVLICPKIWGKRRKTIFILLGFFPVLPLALSWILCRKSSRLLQCESQFSSNLTWPTGLSDSTFDITQFNVFLDRWFSWNHQIGLVRDFFCRCQHVTWDETINKKRITKVTEETLSD